MGVVVLHGELLASRAHALDRISSRGIVRMQIMHDPAWRDPEEVLVVFALEGAEAEELRKAEAAAKEGRKT